MMETNQSRIFLETAKLKHLNSGLGQFCFHLGKALVAQKHKAIEFDFYLPEKRVGILGNVNYVKQNIFHKIFPTNSSAYNLWHCMHQDSPYLPSRKNTPLILTIHDLNVLRRYTGSTLRSKLNRLQKKIDRAEVITAISQFTANEVREHLRLGHKPIHVVHNGNALMEFPDTLKPAFMPDGKFLYSIGIIQKKKNFHTLIPLLKKQPAFQLVIAGNNIGPYASEIREMASHYGVSNRVVMPGEITESEKYWLYKNCEAFLFPSLTEGFGLPVIEAMSAGKPVFLYHGTSLPEVGGSEAYYWSNFDSDHMNDVFMDGMNKYASDTLKQKRIKAWADRFSWSSTAKQYINFYQEYLSNVIPVVPG